MANKKNKRIDVVYSTNPNFQYRVEDENEETTLPNNEQQLYVYLDRKQRKGKEVTIIEGFIGSEDNLKELGRTIKSNCGVGGSVKDGIILIQGNFKEKIKILLEKESYKVKLKG